MASSHPLHSLLSTEQPSPIVRSDLRLASLPPPRFKCGAKLASFTIAAATMAGVQILSFEPDAMASTAGFVDTAIERRAVLTHSPRPESDSLRLNLSVPVVHQNYAIVYGKEDSLSDYVENVGMSKSHLHQDHHEFRRFFKDSGLKCPKWTPSELELIMPNLQGQPKPFPKKGHQWEAVLVDTGMRHELFLHVFHDGADYMNSEDSLVEEIDSEIRSKGSSLPLFKMGKERFVCFSM